MTESEIAAFVDGRLAGGQRVNALAHLSVCSECRLELAEVQALLDTAPPATDARDQYVPGPRRRMKPVYTFAAIASVAAVFLVILTRPPGTTNASLERDAATATSSVSLVAPAASDSVMSSNIRFVWNAQDDATYRITVTGPDGATLWMTTTTDTSLLMPAEKVPGAVTTVHWFVDALRSDGQSISSSSRRVHIRPDR